MARKVRVIRERKNKASGAGSGRPGHAVEPGAPSPKSLRINENPGLAVPVDQGGTARFGALAVGVSDFIYSLRLGGQPPLPR